MAGVVAPTGQPDRSGIPHLLPTVTSGPALTDRCWCRNSVDECVAVEQHPHHRLYRRPGQAVRQFRGAGHGAAYWGDFSDYTLTFQTDFSVPWNQTNAYDGRSFPPTACRTVHHQAAGITGGAGNFAVRMDEYFKRSKGIPKSIISGHAGRRAGWI